jgi:hypothetical protein
MSGIGKAVWTFAILGALSGGAVLTPLFIANASNQCEALEAALLPEMHTVKTTPTPEEGILRRLRAGAKSEGDPPRRSEYEFLEPGAIAAKAMHQEYPSLPSQIGCALTWWRANLHAGTAERLRQRLEISADQQILPAMKGKGGPGF